MKKKLLVMVLAVVGVAFAASAVLADYGDSNTLKGYVKDKATNKGIAKAKLKLFSKSGDSVKDKDTASLKGKYAFDDLDDGTYRVEVKAKGYRNPSNMAKDKLTKVVKVKKDTVKKNLYMSKAE